MNLMKKVNAMKVARMALLFFKQQLSLYCCQPP
jgi:hypothetical protein